MWHDPSISDFIRAFGAESTPEFRECYDAKLRRELDFLVPFLDAVADGRIALDEASVRYEAGRRDFVVDELRRLAVATPKRPVQSFGRKDTNSDGRLSTP